MGSLSTEEVLSVQRAVVRGLLSAPAGFTETPPALIAANCNGCGAKGAKIDFVPDTIYGVDIAPACLIHDWGYFIGRTEEDKNIEDVRFHDNLKLLVDLATLRGWRRWVKWLMLRRAAKYFWGVKEYGDEAFWEGKQTL